MPETARMTMAESKLQASVKTSAPIRWFAGVPIASNPLFLGDLGLILLFLGPGSAIFVTLAQFFMGVSPGKSMFQVTATLAGYVMAFIIAAFATGSLLFFGNRFVALYRLQYDGIYFESMRGAMVPLADFLHWKPFPVSPKLNSGRSVIKFVLWDEVRSIKPHDSLRTILLRGRRGAILRIYCPDETVYNEALDFIRAAVKQ
jgi:hypothetical protein